MQSLAEEQATQSDTRSGTPAAFASLSRARLRKRMIGGGGVPTGAGAISFSGRPSRVCWTTRFFFLRRAPHLMFLGRSKNPGGAFLLLGGAAQIPGGVFVSFFPRHDLL